MTELNKSRAQNLAQQSFTRNDPTGWFEELYSRANGDESAIPWANLTINSNLADWIEQHDVQGQGKTALVVGCGLGDDAEALVGLGFRVTGFDISPTAIDWCQKRFPDSQVDYLVDDLLQPSQINQRQFDFILESYTLQSLPAQVRPQAIKTISQLLAPQGTLLVICRGRDAQEPVATIPFPLTQEELTYFEELGLKQVKFEDNIYQKKSLVRYFRIEYKLEVAKN